MTPPAPVSACPGTVNLICGDGLLNCMIAGALGSTVGSNR